MLQHLSFFIGLRYVRSRTQKFFVSFITWVALLGVCLGVAALIVIISVMNGFEGELRDRLLALSAHARVISSSKVPDWQAAEKIISLQPKIISFAPYAEIQALALHSPEMLPVQLRGIDPQREAYVSQASEVMAEGELTDLKPGAEQLILGALVARQLGVGVGDRLTLLVPGVDAAGTPVPRLREFSVIGIFEAGLQDHDAVLAFTHIETVQALSAGDPRAFGYRLKFTDPLQAPELSSRIAQALPAGLQIRDWTQDNANYFRAIRIEKTMMMLILMLIVAVAAFNIVAMLVMVVTDKRNDIAILRTLGAAPRTIMEIFLIQGLFIGWVGVLLGVFLGVTTALNITEIVSTLEALFGFHLMSPEVYYITAIPMELRIWNIIFIACVAFFLTGCATIYPAFRAAAVQPAEALRYK